MTAQRDPSQRFSLRRWSRRKLEAKAASSPVAPPAPVAPAAPTVPPAPELPPVESLTFNSDFAAFLRPEVDEQVKRAALKQLFRDPRFNIMDGLDTYIDDYTKADPIASDVLVDLLQRGFGGVAEPGVQPGAAPRTGVAAAAESSSAAAEGTSSLSTLAQAAPSPASRDEAAPARRRAEEADGAGTDRDEPFGGKRNDARR